ncbi:MAG: AMP-binding protein [Burkholderiaceae bacterium]
MTEFYDALETRTADSRETALMAALPAQVAAAQATAALAAGLKDVDARAIDSRAALARLPVTRKSELLDRQRESREHGGDPFGGFSAIGWRALGRSRAARRLFQSPGPIYEPDGHDADYWRFARALHAAGLRAGDLVHNSFGYHLTPAGSMMETAAHAIGCTVFPGGVGNTELQLQAMVDLRPDAYAGTPSFLRIALEKVEAAGQLLSIRKASVGGEAFPAALRDWFLARGIAAYQSYGTADLGLVAYETEAREGLVLDERVIVEIVRPGTGEPVRDGEVGEVVVTVLNPDYPLLRFGTGDLSAMLPGTCPTGRTAPRIRGWLGRADQTTKVRGMFVHPAQVAELLKRHPEVVRARLVVSGEMANDRMTLQAEAPTGAADGLADRLAESVRDLTKLRAEIELHPGGSLPNDGKLIDDVRKLA